MGNLRESLALDLAEFLRGRRHDGVGGGDVGLGLGLRFCVFGVAHVGTWVGLSGGEVGWEGDRILEVEVLLMPILVDRESCALSLDRTEIVVRLAQSSSESPDKQGTSLKL